MMTSYFESEKTFCNEIRNKLIEFLRYEIKEINSLGEFGTVISELTAKNEIVLIIDEVDKISNHNLFLDFLGVLRGLYLARALKIFRN